MQATMKYSSSLKKRGTEGTGALEVACSGTTSGGTPDNTPQQVSLYTKVAVRSSSLHFVLATTASLTSLNPALVA
jgi:hypothetical protein